MTQVQLPCPIEECSETIGVDVAFELDAEGPRPPGATTRDLSVRVAGVDMAHVLAAHPEIAVWI